MSKLIFQIAPAQVSPVDHPKCLEPLSKSRRLNSPGISEGDQEPESYEFENGELSYTGTITEALKIRQNHLITEKAFSENSVVTLGIFDNSPSYLADVLCSFITKPPNLIRIAARRKFSNQWNTHHYDDPFTFADLKVYYSIFNALFFEGGFPSLCEFCFRDPDRMPGENGVFCERYTSFITIPSESIVKIIIAKARSNHPSYIQKRAILTTLLQEMSHAYLEIYSCRKESHHTCSKETYDHVEPNEEYDSAAEKVITATRRICIKEHLEVEYLGTGSTTDILRFRVETRTTRLVQSPIETKQVRWATVISG